MLHPAAPRHVVDVDAARIGSGSPTACCCPVAAMSPPAGPASSRTPVSTASTRSRTPSTSPWPGRPGRPAAAAGDLPRQSDRQRRPRRRPGPGHGRHHRHHYHRVHELDVAEDSPLGAIVGTRDRRSPAITTSASPRSAGPDPGRALRRRRDRGRHAGRPRRLVSRRPVASGGLGRHRPGPGRSIRPLRRRAATAETRHALTRAPRLSKACLSLSKGLGCKRSSTCRFDKLEGGSTGGARLLDDLASRSVTICRRLSVVSVLRFCGRTGRRPPRPRRR